MSSLFGALNYLTGFFVFWIIFRYVRTDELRKKLVGVFCAATFLVVAFALVQKFISLELGNTAVFIHLERLNSTLKDPNSLGIFLAASFPVLLGYALSVTKKARIPIAALLVLILYIFPDAGSRSGMLGLVVALVVFLVLWQVKQNWDKKKRALLYLAALSISTVLISSYALFFKDTNLISRLGDNVRQFKGEIVVPEMGIAMGRQYLWRIGIEMFEESPVTGMGLGAYIIDLPNFAEEMDFSLYSTDSSENYFVQVAAELGIIGLCLAIWLFIGIMRLLRENLISNRSEGSRDFIKIGLICGIVAVLVNFMLHTYIGAYDVKYLFWFMVGLLAASSTPKELGKVSRKSSRKSFWLPALLLILVFGSVHLRNSLGPLSLEKRAERFGWSQNFGFFAQENDDRQVYFRWAEKMSGLQVPVLGRSVVVPLMASHSGIEHHPLSVEISLADKYFNPALKLEHLEIGDRAWREFRLDWERNHQDRINLVFECSRTWQPFKVDGTPDLRNLGVAFGEIWYVPHLEGDTGHYQTLEMIPSDNWDGKLKSAMFSNGTSFIDFSNSQPCHAIRIRFRGDLAFDVGPLFVVKIDQDIVGKTMLGDEEWTSLFFPVSMAAGEHRVSVEFLNDSGEANPIQDRNLFLGQVEILVKN